jgi:hypothetical protein
MEIPIPFALSLLIIAESIAKELKIMESITPTMMSEKPTSSEEYNSIGTPQPIKNAKTSAEDNPRNKLNQIFTLAIG